MFTLIPVCFSKLAMVSGAMKSDHQKRLRTPASWDFLPQRPEAVRRVEVTPLTRRGRASATAAKHMGTTARPSFPALPVRPLGPFFD
jgi:hypothetical protein